MNTHSNVTVIIPCYNDGQYILQALQSIYNQTVLPEKIIIVDDGSGIETKGILASIQHSLVQIVYQENQGVSVARNKAIALAQTDFIVNLDADDYYEAAFIEKALAILNMQPTVGVISSYCRTFNDKGTIEIVKPIGGIITDFIVINSGRASAMFRKSCWTQVGGYDERMIEGYEDWELWIGITKNGWAMDIIREVLSHYRVKNESRDHTAIKEHDFELRQYIMNKHKEVYLAHFDFFSSELVRQNSLLRTSIKNMKESKEFRLGQILLAPGRYLKKKFLK
jgi:hypothetical protein